MPALMLLVMIAVSCVAAVTVKLQCLAAAREAALVSARGGPGAEAGSAMAPPGADIRIAAGPATVRATVRCSFHVLGVHLPAVSVAGSAVAATEPGAPQ